MPLPNPHKDETEQDFVSRCIGLVVDDGTVDNTEAGRAQAAAMCFRQWRDAKKAADLPDTTTGRAYSTLIIKSIDNEQRIIEGVASTPTPDRVDDVVDPMGGVFKLPMPLLWQHDSRQPVGNVIWAEATKAGIPFKAMLAKTSEPGTLKDRLDEAWQSIKLGLVRAVSIGFRTLEAEPVDAKDPWGGTRFKKWEWLELSAVTIPANIDATIHTIRSIDTKARAASGNAQKQMSPQANESEQEFMDRCQLAGDSKSDCQDMWDSMKAASGHLDLSEIQRPTASGRREGTPGIINLPLTASGQTTSPSASRHKPTVKAQESKMATKKTIADQISDWEARRFANAERVNQLMSEAAEKSETLDDAAKDECDGLDAENAKIDDHLVRLRKLEQANKSQAVAVETQPEKQRSSIISVKQPKLEKGTNFFRYCQVMMMAKGNKFEAINYVQQNPRWMNESPQLVDVLRTAVAAGTTDDSTWAGPLVPNYTHMASEFIELLRAETILGRLAGFRRVPFNISVPRQTAGTSVNWVGEGQPKPLTKGAFDTVQLRWAKVAGIVAFTQELIRFSNPSAESIIRADLTAAVSQFLDEQFVDPSKVEVANVSPASITNGADTSSASGETAAAFLADAKLAIANFVLDNISLAGCVWLMTPLQATSLSLMKHTNSGLAEFPDINPNGGSLLGFPVITSNNVPSGTIIFLKPAEILLADDGGVDVQVSTEASLQMDDDPSSGEQQVVSLFQNNMIALRVERFINWKLRRPNAVYVITGADYGGIGTGT